MVGERLLGRFLIEERIGSGGFGTVYRAWDERLQRPVAVKTVELRDGSPRVTREAQAVARLTHRNIATLYELAGEGNRAFLVSELIEGETVRELGRRGELSDRMVAEVGADAAAALVHAHRHGVVHRDVKPENILVAPGGAKLVDFGIARIAGERSLTATGAVIGTLAYMAPEQADGLRPGPAADVYSLALTLYESFCGEHPLLREGPAATARAIGQEVPPLGDVRPDLPEQFTETIDACLDPDPERRPLASDLAWVLNAHAHGLDGRALPPIEGPGEEAPAPSRAPPLGRIAPALGISVLVAAGLAASGAPVALLVAAPVAGLLALARPRPALAIGAGVTFSWLLIGAGEPGAALLWAFMVALLLLPIGDPRAAPLPALALPLGLLGLAPIYPALAGLTGSAAGRAMLGATGYVWLAATERILNRKLLFGAEVGAPEGWQQSAGLTFGDVLLPLMSGAVLATAAVWAIAAAVLPLLVCGRAPVLDWVGALIWTAALISALRVVGGPGDDPPGLLFAAMLAGLTAALLARRLQSAAPPAAPAPGGTGVGGTA